MLLKVLDFIKQHKLVSTQQLQREFNLDLSALIPMLDIWQRKGIIKECPLGSGCKKSCGKCVFNKNKYFQLQN